MRPEDKQRIERLRQYFDGEPFGSQINRDVNILCDRLEEVERKTWWQRLLGS